jgi:hypothetical protein
MPLTKLFNVLWTPAKDYVVKECEDAGLFVVYALAQGYNAGTPAKALKLAKAAAKWVVEHGTPTPEKVKETLGL